MPLFSGGGFTVQKCLGVNLSARQRALTLTHSEVEELTISRLTHRVHHLRETWHLRERSCPCPRWQGGSNPALSIPPRSHCTGGKRWRASLALLSHSSQGQLPVVTSWRPSQGHPGCGLSEATGCRCLALQNPRCSWRPAAPAGRGLWPVSVLASQQSDRQSAVCNMSGRPEPGNRDGTVERKYH